MYIDFFGIKIHIGFVSAAAIALLVNRGLDGAFAAGIIGLFLHEMTHLVCLILCGCRRSAVEICPGGLRISADGFDTVGYKRSAICLLSAPCMNVFLGILFLTVSVIRDSEKAEIFSYANFALGLVNLLPLSLLDGGMALEALLLYRKDIYFAEKIKKTADAVCIFIMTAVTAISFLWGFGNYYLLAFSVYSFFNLLFARCLKKSC